MQPIKKKIWFFLLIIVLQVTFSSSIVAAAPLDVMQVLGASTVATDTSGGGLLGGLFHFIFDKILGPLLHLGNSGSGAVIAPLPAPASGTNSGGAGGALSGDGGFLGKTILIDPGHGGSNPGAVANGFHEADNNLAVALKLQKQLLQKGAKVIMTRSSDQTVAPEGSTLTQELAARVALAEQKHADLFISIHTNENSDAAISGATTFYSSDSSSRLARLVQSALVKNTGAIDKGISSANFYVIRNPSMPSILVEMGFISNPTEAVKLNSDSYRNQIAEGILKGIAAYLN